ncbi:MAG: sodium-dependent transporter [Candidatus Thermoplasmatota archaeon]|nr:sodium-dependent transporter [Candidatus Thermoplasmatota archaeon]
MAMERERWTSRSAFIFAAIGSAIGLGNLWRFPYLAYRYGGGAFLIPYIISVFVLGIPWIFLEMSAGHLSRTGAPGSFRMVSKKLEWAGWFQVFVSFILNTYYVIIVGWALCYMIFSIYLPWGVGKECVYGVESFFFNEFLGVTEGPGVAGGFSIPIVVATILAWALIYFIISRGVKRIGKVSTYFVILAWISLIIFTIRGLTLPGAVDIGLNSYLTPDFSAIADAEVWFGAFSQVAFSLSLGMGIMYAYASYLPEESDTNNNLMITALADMGTAFFSGFAIFSSAGFLAYSLGIDMSEITMSGIALTFVTIPTSISMMPTVPQVFGVIFFVSLFMLGVTSAYSITEAFVTSVVDKFKVSRRKATALVCFIPAAIGVFVFARGFGIHWLDMVDRGVSYYGVLIGGLLSCIVFGWIYGSDRLREHTNRISEITFGRWIDVAAKFIAPAAVIFVIIWGLFVTGDVFGYGDYDLWASTLGIWGSLLVAFVLSIIFASRGEV